MSAMMNRNQNPHFATNAGLTAPSVDYLQDPQWRWVQAELDRMLGLLRQSQGLDMSLANQINQNRSQDAYNQIREQDMNLRVGGQQYGFQNETFGLQNQLAGLQQANARYLQGLDQSLAAQQYNRSVNERPSAYEQGKRMLGY